MDEKKIVTWEMFKKYHEQLTGMPIDDGDEQYEIIIEDFETNIDKE